MSPPSTPAKSPAADVGEGWTTYSVERKVKVKVKGDRGDRGGKGDDEASGGGGARSRPPAVDRYWLSPGGRRFRSRAEVGRFVAALAGSGGGDEDAAWSALKAAKALKAKAAAEKGNKGEPSGAEEKKADDDEGGDDDDDGLDPRPPSSAAGAGATKTKTKKKKKAAKETKTKKKAAKKPAKDKAPVAKAESDDEEEEEADEEADEETKPKPKLEPPKKKTKKRKKKAAASSSSSSDEEAPAEPRAAKARAEAGRSAGRKRAKRAAAAAATEEEEEEEVEVPPDEDAAMEDAGADGGADASINPNVDEDEDEDEDAPPPIRSGGGRRRRSTARAPVRYNEDELGDFDSGASSASDGSDGDSDGGDDFVRKPGGGAKKKKKRRKGKGKGSAAAAAANKRKKRADSDSDSDGAFSVESEEEEDDDDDDDLDFDDEDGESSGGEEEEEDFDEESEEEPPAVAGGRKKGRAAAKGRKKKPPAAAAAAKKKTKSKASGSDGIGGNGSGSGSSTLEDLMAKESYNPKNTPQGFVQPFVEPVGVDPTDGIVEGIVAAQVRKVGGLLRDAIRAEGGGGAAGTPLRLQTACSGTDAPSIALNLVREQLDRIYGSAEAEAEEGKEGTGSGSVSGSDRHGFRYEHVMSCEIEPFKQAYISRNFPETPLFPDIVKLTGGGPVADVFGRRRAIPEGDLFVAGTSCKDFSMLKSNLRLDIEDRGQSGQTFLAAVEFLEEFRPGMAIFENVLNAPWSKMQEYITGMVPLGSVYTKVKGIGGAAKKSEAKELMFSVDGDDRYRVEAVPRQTGVKAGCAVEGFIRGADDDGEVIPLSAKGKGTKGTISLATLAKSHKIDMKNDTLVLEKKVRYATRLCKVSTKKFGLPQTRERQYLFVWKTDDRNDDLGEYYEEILRHLEAPIIHSIEAFFLPPTHDRLRSFREALRSGPGLILARDRARDPDFWNYDLTQNKDAPRHMRFRSDNGIEERSRWLTGWNTMGRKNLAPSLMPELYDMWNHRRLDMIDCFAGAAMRDATPRDALHHLFTWDISQNVTRAQFRDGDIGVTGCVTPAGEIVVPHLGRSMMGFEKLLLQGIPFSRLMLGNETEVQLSDLAGNAMSLPVVCATMLAAITAKQLRRERVSNGRYLLKNAAISSTFDSAKGAVLSERGDLYGSKQAGKGPNVLVSFRATLDLADDAYKASVLCTCESSGRTTSAENIVECSGCGVTICQDCADRHRTESHDLHEMRVSPKDRGDPRSFDRQLRRTVPATLRLGANAVELLENGHGLESYSFKLQQVERLRGHWELVYGAKEDFGNGRQVAECRVKLGRVETLGKQNGLLATMKCFGPAIRDNPHRGRLQISAKVLLLKGDDLKNASWQVPCSNSSSKVQIIGSEESPSQRVVMGLTDKASKVLKAHKVQKSRIPQIVSRNPTVHYHPMWKVWPGKIEILDGDSAINGVYERLSCEQTIPFSALWRRHGHDSPVMYIYIRPDVSRAGLDVAVVSPTPSYRDGAEIAELVDWIPENALEPKTHKSTVKRMKWKDEPNLTIEVATERLTVVSPKDFSPTSDAPVSLCSINGMAVESISSLNGEVDGSTVIVDLVGSKGVQNTKRLSTIAAPVLLQHAAKNCLPLDCEGYKWYDLKPSGLSFGCSPTHVPTRPSEKWVAVAGRDGLVTRVYDAEESNDYYLAYHNRPKAWTIAVNNTSGNLTVLMNPNVAGHHAAAALVDGRVNEGKLNVSYRLSELSSMAEPNTEEFRVPNSDTYQPTTVDGLELPLYPRQAKALTRMRAIESGEVIFSEEERSEDVLPGVGWCLIGRAARKSKLRGGVLGDAIGSGKTVVTIGLILAGIEEARGACDVEKGISGATLIVVPPALVQQWDDERVKFTAKQLKSIIIDSTTALKKHTVKEICEADIIIVPVSILEESVGTGNQRPYTDNLCKKAGASKPMPKAPTKFSQREAPSIEGTWIRNQASGPDPYVGNKGSQRNRDAQAYYSHCYEKTIEKLRKKSFSPTTKGVPLEYFTWRRVVVDECHETLVTSKRESFGDEDYKDNARRGAREFLGVAQTDYRKRPLLATVGVWGLTGTPLLETEARVTELANLMGGTYVTGAAYHWRREERESGRDMFLNMQQGVRSRAYRCAVQDAAHEYVKQACQRNRGAKLQVKVIRCDARVNMSSEEGDRFLASVKSATEGAANTFTLSLQDVPDSENAKKILDVTASAESRSRKLLDTIERAHEKNPDSKIIVFADVRHGGHAAACQALNRADTKFVSIDEEESVQIQNEKISWFRHRDVTDEEKARPRILVLSFEQAAGHNLQHACSNIVMYDPRYSGHDAVADASVEEQAIGRVLRQGQTKDVNVTRIILCGPGGERCVDDWIIERNMDEKVLQAATSNFD